MSVKLGDVRFEDAMEIAGYGKYSVFIVLLSGFTLFTSLLGSVDVSFLMPAAECDFNLTSHDKGLLSSAYFFGIILASHLSGFLSDTMGRRNILFKCLSINFLMFFGGCLAPNFWTFFTLKVISGILTCPTMIATFPFLGEFVPGTRRPQALLIATALSFTSLLYSSIIGWTTLQGTWKLDLVFITFSPWRLFYFLCGIPTLLCGIFFYLTPESPKFLLTKGKKEESLRVLKKVYSINSGNPPQNYPVQSICMDADEVVPPAPGKGLCGLLKHICDQTLPLFKPPFLKNLLLSVTLMFTSLLGVNSFFLWLPEVTNRIALSHTPSEDSYMCQMVMVDSAIITETTINSTSSTLGVCDTTINTAIFMPNIVIGVVQPVVMLSASVFVSIFDRRLIITILLLICCIIAQALTWIPQATVIIILFGAIPILTAICYNVLTGILIELFPTYIRAMAVSLTMTCGRLGSIVGSQLFSLMIDFHCQHLFQVISFLMLCCAPLPFYFKMKVQNQNN